MNYALMQQRPLVINPQRVTHYITPPYQALQNLLCPLEWLGVTRISARLAQSRYVFGGDWEVQAFPFTERAQYRRLRSLADALPDFRASNWYQEGLAAIQSGGSFHHRRHFAHSVAELDALFASLLVPMLESMQQTGYQQRPGDDQSLWIIGRDGTVYKSRHARHRFAAALVTGVCSGFPGVVDTVHREWWTREVLPGSGSLHQRFNAALARLEARYQ